MDIIKNWKFENFCTKFYLIEPPFVSFPNEISNSGQFYTNFFDLN